MPPKLGWQLLFPLTVLGVARSNSITVTAVILSLTAVIFVRVTKLLSPKKWTVIYSITVLEYYCVGNVGTQYVFWRAKIDWWVRK